MGEINPILGGSALLRIAGLPVRLWLAGGCPELFVSLSGAQKLACDYRRRARVVAEGIGSALVPHPGLNDGDRRKLLALRRHLHNGLPVSVAQRSALSALVARISRLDGSVRQLAEELLATVECGQRLRAAEERVTQDLHIEQRRIQELPWLLLCTSPTAAAAAVGDIPELIDEIKRRLATGEEWDSKRLRHRAGYLWRLVTRGAVKTTPRGWFGQVALVPVDGCQASPDLLVGVESAGQPMAGAQATHQLSNVHQARSGAANSEVVSLPGLHWIEGQYLVCWVVDALDHGRMRQLRLKNTPLLHMIGLALTDGPRHRSELLAQLSGTQTTQAEVLASFLDHLIGLGVLQTSSELTERVSGWQPPPRHTFAERHTSVGQHTFTDVYRQVSCVVSGTAANQIERAIHTALRLGALVRAARTSAPHPALELLDEQPRSVTDLIRQYLHQYPEWAQRPLRRLGWPRPTPGSGYARLLTALESVPGSEPIVIDEELLDALGAQPAPLSWPVDARLRPLPARSGVLAVLEAVVPAGILDARFAGALDQLCGELATVCAYREFLRAVENELGGQFVELLCPPLSDQAANAVTRPRYTRLYTGDPAHASYYRPGPGRSDYLPLQEITLHRSGSRVVAQTRGRLLFPICHSTRLTLPPWDVVHALLTNAALPGSNRGLSLGGALAAFPDRDHLPRMVVDDTLVVSREQWRVRRTELWTPTTDLSTQARALSQLMRRGLPRWVILRAHGGRSVPVDLQSLLSIRQLDRMLADPTVEELIVEEMLPRPDQFLVADTAHAPDDRLAAQLLLRIPLEQTPSEQARRACATWRSTQPPHAWDGVKLEPAMKGDRP